MGSVLDRPYPRREYIVMDGGSTDNSIEIIRKYADRLAYWSSEPDQGQYAAINTGFAHATGEVDVRSVPFQSDASHVARYFQAADVYVHSAHTDNFPNTVLEALACGLPVVATAVGGIPKQVNDGETGFLTPPRDPLAMASRIDQLFIDYDLRKSMGERAVADARGRFDLNRQVGAYLDWYAEILLQNNSHIDGH